MVKIIKVPKKIVNKGVYETSLYLSIANKNKINEIISVLNKLTKPQEEDKKKTRKLYDKLF